MIGDPERPPGRTPRLPRRRAALRRIGVIVLVTTLLFAAAAAAALRFAPPAYRFAPPARAGADVARAALVPAASFPGGRDAASNILPEDYAGPDACARCHKENYTNWLAHPHRRMNQLASDATVLGDFDGRVIQIGEGSARFEHAAGGDFTLTLDRAGEAQRVYRVTRTIGVRLKQFYVGLLVRGPPVARNSASDEVVLPFGWWVHQRRWMPINAFDPYGDDIDAHGKASFDPWRPKDVPIAINCVYCHNTMPYLYRFGTGRTGLGFRPQDVLLDVPTLRRELGARVKLSADAQLPPASQVRLPLSTLVSVGISCESCHFGARAHAEDEKDYRFGASSPHFRGRPSDPHESDERSKENPWLVKTICRQCHASDGATYPDGSSLINSREALELDAGNCASKIACTNCHNPHVAGPAQEAGPDNPKHIAACTGCHTQYSDAGVARGHARHTPTQATCLDCHMPRITPGVTRTNRSHRISSPVDPRMLAAAAPNACNLCHLEKSVAWTIAELERGWGKRIEADASWARAWDGSLDNPAIDVWAHSTLEQTRVALTEALGARRDRDSLARLVARLEDPVIRSRAYAQIAIEARIGRSLDSKELDVAAVPQQRALQIAALRLSLRLPADGAPGSPTRTRMPTAQP